MTNPLLVLFGLQIVLAMTAVRMVSFSLQAMEEPYERVWSQFGMHPSKVPRGVSLALDPI
ncbi:MAG TPA: hypothetical protein VJB97_03020 [Candidatus Paceibacterota bacterium]